jgi:hypothetical protein
MAAPTVAMNRDAHAYSERQSARALSLDATWLPEIMFTPTSDSAQGEK